jgi:4,5-DOPA dioxygenase extradiol
MAEAPAMPVVFFGHGSPTIALEQNDVTATWRRVALSMPPPKAILCISAHWVTQGTAVTALSHPGTIHDFGPIAPGLFDIQYLAPGSPALANRVRDLLAPVPVALDEGWGLDHGAWSVLMKAWPDADVPVVQLSMDGTRDAAWHYAIGQALGPLRDEGVLILGSGNTVHNLGTMSWQGRYDAPYDWAARFSDQIRDAVLADEPDRVIHYTALGADAARAQPTPDHYWPLLYVLGARRPGDVATAPVDHIEYKSVGMTSFVLR